MLIYSLISLLRHLGWFGTSLQVGCRVGGSPPAAISARACYRAATMFCTNQRVTGRGPLNPVRSNCSSRRRLIMREKVGMLFGHLKRISDWTHCACVAKRCERQVPLTTTAQDWGVGQTDPRTHRQSSPHEARRVKLRLARKCRERHLPSAVFFSASHLARPFEVLAPQVTPLAHDLPAFCDELSSPTRSELHLR